VHGAYRLASNSLLEAAVFGTRAGEVARDAAASRSSPLAARPAPDLPALALRRLREAMSRDAGVVRDAGGLKRLIGLIDDLQARHGAALPLVTARLVAEQALARQESRGAHFRADFPEAAATPRRTHLTLTQALAPGAAEGKAA
jgi:L-aspartate oxidase